MEKEGLEFIEDITSNVDEVQKRVLTEILSENANVEYLQRHGLNGQTDRDTFKKLMPLITYEDIRSDINRIAYGDKSSIFCSKPISLFFSSSGTSGGENKLIPVADGVMERRLKLHQLKWCVINQVDPDHGNGIGMYFLFIKPEEKTPGGIPITTASAYSLKHHYFDFMEKTDIAPILSLHSYQNMYSQLLCGLSRNQQVLRVGSVFAVGFVRAIRFLEQHWSLLCDDIRTGTLSTTQITDPSVRHAVMKILKPDPNLADFIDTECKKGSWRGIVTRLWPNAKYVDAIATGTMSQYTSIIDYYTNNLPIVSKFYSSSEYSLGINLNPFCKPDEIVYTLIPTMCYFEFLPYNTSNGMVDLADVEIGQDYELVITTCSGLYRYKVGDVLRVAGFKNKAPQFKFICRENVVLCIDNDLTNEADLQIAVKKAASHLMPFDAHVTEYTSCVDIATSDPSHYVIFWELNQTGSNQIPDSILEECCFTIEESLNFNYRRGRAFEKSIGPLEIRIVENGTFDKLMDYCVNSLGASMSQYKTPRCLKNAPLVELLKSGVVSTYFSPKCPQWVPGIKKWNNTN